ncbi:MAG TPA: (2Fe-2S)-binding protein, partial [Kofleriaceae bacterium]
AFIRDWLGEHEPPDELVAIRAELRGLGAELVVLSETGVWSFRPDDDVDRYGSGPQLAREIARLAERYGVSPGSEAVFVVDERNQVRFAHRASGALESSLADALAAAGEALLAPAAPPVLFSRREWNLTALVTGFAFVLGAGCKTRSRTKERPAARPVPATVNDIAIELHINGKTQKLRVDPRTSLLDALRERLGLTGTKKGCDMGQCGSCTVLADGQRILACLTLAAMAQGPKLVTIEGLANGNDLHPMQRAFIEHDGLQCGYCTPGQILSAVALLAEGRAKTDAEVREQMSGNLCRCGAYPNIVAAIQAARRGA